MSKRPTRPFTIVDAMILVAATAIGLALTRDDVVRFFTQRDPRAMRSSPFDEAYSIALPMTEVWMLALIPLRLRRPRPGRRRLARQPGFMACIAVAAVLVEGWLEYLPAILKYPASSFVWFLGTARRSPAIAGAWLFLALTGRWRAEPGWIDRLGRLLAMFQLSWLLVVPFRVWLARLFTLA